MCGTGVALSKSMREAASNSDIWLMLNVKVDLGLDKIKLQFVRVIISEILALISIILENLSTHNSLYLKYYLMR